MSCGSIIATGGMWSGTGALYFWGASGNRALPGILPGQADHGMTGQMHLEHLGIAAYVTLSSRSETCKNVGDGVNQCTVSVKKV